MHFKVFVERFEMSVFLVLWLQTKIVYKTELKTEKDPCNTTAGIITVICTSSNNDIK